MYDHLAGTIFVCDNQASQVSQQRGFARAGGTDERNHFTWHDFQRDAIEGALIAK
jgi:hypothetical protein